MLNDLFPWVVILDMPLIKGIRQFPPSMRQSVVASVSHQQISKMQRKGTVIPALSFQFYLVYLDNPEN